MRCQLLAPERTRRQHWLAEYVEEILEACTLCEKRVEAWPDVEPGSIFGTKSEYVIGGILKLVRTGIGPGASRQCALKQAFDLQSIFNPGKIVPVG